MKLAKRAISILLAGTLAFSLVACNQSKDSSSQSVKSQTGEVQPTGEPKTATYPLTTEDKVLTVYIRDSSSGVAENYGKIKAFQAAADKLGVKLEFIHPAVGSESDQFNLMIGSKEYPDIIAWDFSTTPMGIDELINTGVLVDMDSYIRQYAPNYLSIVNSSEDYKKETVSDEGKFQKFCCFTLGVPVSAGPTIRMDLLKKHNLEVPQTVEEWENALTTIKNQESSVQYPYSTSKNYIGNVNLDLLLPAYNTRMEFCKDDKTGEVVFGPATENYKQYVTKLNEWYNSGLLDPEFMSNDSAALNAKLAKGYSVAASISLNSGIGNVSNTARQTDPNFEFVGAAWPVANKGDTPSYVLAGGTMHLGLQAAITSACKDPELATQVLDYFYSEEGNTLLSWGVEGESYTVNADGSKTFVDEILKNPDGKSAAEAVLSYALPQYGFVNQMDEDAYSQIVLPLPEQVAARQLWHGLDQGVTLPKLTIGADNQNDYNMIMNEVNTYVQEMLIQFVTGQADINAQWENYIGTLNGMSLDTARQFVAEAYEKFEQR